MGVWGTHQYLGNIIGLAMAAAFADEVNNNNDNTSTQRYFSELSNAN